MKESCPEGQLPWAWQLPARWALRCLVNGEHSGWKKGGCHENVSVCRAYEFLEIKLER